MNEHKIRLIADKASELCKKNAHGAPAEWEWEYKFAELIVRECISVMKSTVDESIDFERKLDETSCWIESDIKKHFGIEE